MIPNGLRRWVISVGFVMLVVGILLGAVVGGLSAYWFADQWHQPQAVSVVQPLDGKLLAPSAPAAPAEEELPVPTETPSIEAPTEEAPVPTSDEPVVAAVQRVQPATVLVLTPNGTGSGVIISEDGYIVTNNHVIQGAQQFAVVYARGEQVPATLVGAAPEYDLAILKVEGAVPAVAAWGDSSAIPVGGQVIAIGSALGEYQNTVTLGILSGVNRELGGLPGLLQTDAAINHGNSGGPLLNRAGEVIGINTMVVRGGASEAEGLGFAIPSNLARSVATQLIETGQVQRPYIGVEYAALNPQVAQQQGLSITEGALIQAVSPNSPSAQVGIQAGDVIVAINEKPVNDREPLVIHILSHSVGEVVSVTVLRDGEELTFDLTLAPRQA